MDRTMVYRSGAPSVLVVVVRHHSYKHPEWWERCKASILAQRNVNLTLLTVNNEDNAFTIGEALNLAASFMERQEWFYHISDDDWFRDEDALHHLIAVGEGADAHIVHHRSLIVDTDGRPWMQGPGPIGLIRGWVVKEHPYTNRSLLEDREWLDRVAKQGIQAAKSPRAVYAYRMHAEQASKALKEEAGLYEDLRERGAWID